MLLSIALIVCTLGAWADDVKDPDPKQQEDEQTEVDATCEVDEVISDALDVVMEEEEDDDGLTIFGIRLPWDYFNVPTKEKNFMISRKPRAFTKY